MDLNTVWFLLILVLFAGYAILDGFDLGVGILHLFHKSDTDRRLSLNSIGPVWDGNEVWLVTGGGALFAAFPEVYATVFSGFYIALMLLLGSLIFRAVAIEFRSKNKSPRWRRFWDRAFSLGSLFTALLLGVAFGNVAAGVPLDANRNVSVGLLALLHPYAVLVGISTVALFALHGAIFLSLKTDGAMQNRVRSWIPLLMCIFGACYILTTIATLSQQHHLAARFSGNPAWWFVPAVTLLAIAGTVYEIKKGRDFRAFVCSSITIALLVALVAIGIFPNIILSDPIENSLTIYNAASSPKTLKIMLTIALIGMPMVLSYTIAIYWVFRSKVKLDEHSY